MKHFLEFARTGHTFEERIGEAQEVDAAFGRIALGFSLLEDMLRGTIQVLLTTEANVASIVTAEMSSRQLVDVLGSLGRHRIETIVEEVGQQDAKEYLDEVLRLCRKSEELRNTYFHSSYSPELRVKTTAKASRGLQVKSEKVDSSLLLDVADFISETAWICQELPVGIGFADEARGDGDTVEYLRGGHSVGTYTLPGASAQPNKRLQPAARAAVVERRG